MFEALLEGILADEDLRQGLAPAGFTDWRAAGRRLQRMSSTPEARRALGKVLPHLLVQLGGVAGPDNVLVNLERLAGAIGDPARLFRYLAKDPRTIDILAVIFSSSQFLTEIVLRNPALVEQVTEQARTAEIKTPEQYLREGLAAMDLATEPAHRLDCLRRYQRGELLRIGTCDLLDQFDLAVVTGQLSALADGMARACLKEISARREACRSSEGFAVLAMGKLGGRELNYSSDIDLVFLCDSDREVTTRLGQRLVDALSGVSDEGFLYRVDLRLRPWGRTGALVPTIEGYLAYLREGAQLWEKQALLKARCIAGDFRLGEDFLRRASGMIYGSSAGTVRAEVFAMKQRTEAQLRQQGRAWGEVKLGEGSIRDIEFVAQYLQLAYGGKQPEIRSRNTLHAIQRLLRYGYLSIEESRTLSEGYIFLRTVEHYLQMLHYRQTYTLPKEPEALAHLSRRLGFQGQRAGEQFAERYQQHSAAIRAIFLKYLGEQTMAKDEQGPSQEPRVERHIARMDPSYEAVFSAQDVARHAALIEELDAERLVQVDPAELEDGRWRVTIVAYDYPGELALICGLMLVHGLAIDEGNVFTYEAGSMKPGAPGKPEPRKIVDVMTVHSTGRSVSAGLWKRYEDDLLDLLRLTKAGQRQEARVQMAKRAAESLERGPAGSLRLYPIDIEIDNEVSQRYTVLRITGTDTPGFLYELANALAFHRIYIAQVEIETEGTRVRDTLHVTDSDGRKITTPDRQRELKAATVLIKHFTHLLPFSPDPESALLHFHAFIGELFRHPNWPDELASLERPEVLSALAQLLGVSDFLWDDFLRMQHANLFPVVQNVDTLETARSREQLEDELGEALRTARQEEQGAGDGPPWRDALNAFKDREMFRVDMRHILGHTLEFWEFAEELTELAEVVVSAAVRQVLADVERQHGEPLREDGSPAKLAVLALGKLGGRELGFASDIELMFVYGGNGKTTGPAVITTGEFYEKVVENFMRAIRARREGIFEVDLQLRPYGKAGSLAVSVEAFRRYFSPGGPAWPYERQALVRMRPIAGDAGLGQQMLRLRDACVYTGEPFDVTAMHAMRERQLRHLVKAGTFNAKYSLGGLVDVEYLVQGLQISHGAEILSLRTANVREAIAALAEAGILSGEDYPRLRRAYTFLRWLIDSLRTVAGNAKDLVVPPEDSEEFTYLARRLRFGGSHEKLHSELLTHTAFVQEINRRMLDQSR